MTHSATYRGAIGSAPGQGGAAELG